MLLKNDEGNILTVSFLAISKCYGKVQVLFSARQLSFQPATRAQFMRSWSSGKRLAFQLRGFAFEPVRMRLFFYKPSEAEPVPFFSALRRPLTFFVQIFRHYETVQNSHFLSFEIFVKAPKSPPSIFDILQQWMS